MKDPIKKTEEEQLQESNNTPKPKAKPVRKSLVRKPVTTLPASKAKPEKTEKTIDVTIPAETVPIAKSAKQISVADERSIQEKAIKKPKSVKVKVEKTEIPGPDLKALKKLKKAEQKVEKLTKKVKKSKKKEVKKSKIKSLKEKLLKALDKLKRKSKKIKKEGK
jgi:hypothetical protein